MSYQYAPLPPHTNPASVITPPQGRFEPAALIAFLLALGSLLIPVFPAIASLALVPGARRNIRASKGLRTGKGLLVAAATLSILTLMANAGVALWLFFVQTT